MDVLSVSSRGQIVIPEKVRRRFKITKGSKLVLIEQDDALILKKEEDVAAQLAFDRQERAGWQMLTAHSLKKVWDNPEDEAEWKRYL